MGALGFKGLLITSTWHGEFIDGEPAFSFWEWAQARHVPVFIHPPRVPIGHAQQMDQYKLDELVGRPFDSAMALARMILSGLFDPYPRLKIVVAHMGGGLLPVVGRLDFGWQLGCDGMPERAVIRCKQRAQVLCLAVCQRQQVAEHSTLRCRTASSARSSGCGLPKSGMRAADRCSRAPTEKAPQCDLRHMDRAVPCAMSKVTLTMEGLMRLRPTGSTAVVLAAVTFAVTAASPRPAQAFFFLPMLFQNQPIGGGQQQGRSDNKWRDESARPSKPSTTTRSRDDDDKPSSSSAGKGSRSSTKSEAKSNSDKGSRSSTKSEAKSNSGQASRSWSAKQEPPASKSAKQEPPASKSSSRASTAARTGSGNSGGAKTPAQEPSGTEEAELTRQCFASVTSGRYDQAIGLCTRVIAINPKNALAFHYLGGAYFYKNDYYQAIANYSQAVRLDPKDANSFRGRGGSYLQLKEYDLAIVDFNAAIGLNRGDALAFLQRADAYASKNDHYQAIADYSAAIRLDPNDAGAWNNRGVSKWFIGDMSGSDADLERARQLNPMLIPN